MPKLLTGCNYRKKDCDFFYKRVNYTFLHNIQYRSIHYIIQISFVAFLVFTASSLVHLITAVSLTLRSYWFIWLLLCLSHCVLIGSSDYCCVPLIAFLLVRLITAVSPPLHSYWLIWLLLCLSIAFQLVHLITAVSLHFVLLVHLITAVSLSLRSYWFIWLLLCLSHCVPIGWSDCCCVSPIAFLLVHLITAVSLPLRSYWYSTFENCYASPIAFLLVHLITGVSLPSRSYWFIWLLLCLPHCVPIG